MSDRKEIEDLIGEKIEDMGLGGHFDDEGQILKKECTDCGCEIPMDSRYGDCGYCLNKRYGTLGY